MCGAESGVSRHALFQRKLFDFGDWSMEELSINRLWELYMGSMCASIMVESLAIAGVLVVLCLTVTAPFANDCFPYCVENSSCPFYAVVGLCESVKVGNPIVVSSDRITGPIRCLHEICRGGTIVDGCFIISMAGIVRRVLWAL